MKSEKRNSLKTWEWSRLVKQRDAYICQICGSNQKLHSHHIIPWRVDISKRFDISNGITLCSSCHGKEEGFQKGHKTEMTPEIRKKISESHKGKSLGIHRSIQTEFKKGLSPWNKGKKLSDEQIKKMSEAKKGKPGNRKGKKSKKPTWNKGLRHSDEVRKKMSNARLGKTPWNKGLKNGCFEQS